MHEGGREGGRVAVKERKTERGRQGGRLLQQPPLLLSGGQGWGKREREREKGRKGTS